MNKKLVILPILLGIILLTSSYKQEVKKSKEKKILIILGSTKKLWTQKEYFDSINWSKVKMVNSISDSVAIKKYGEKGKNGAFIIFFKDSVPNKSKQTQVSNNKSKY